MFTDHMLRLMLNRFTRDTSEELIEDLEGIKDAFECDRSYFYKTAAERKEALRDVWQNALVLGVKLGVKYSKELK